MKRETVKRPTDAELAILEVLWERGPSPVRKVHLVLNARRQRAYTTTLKQMQVMTGKGLLIRDESRRPQIYSPAQEDHQTQQQLLDHLIEGAFGGSARRLVMQALRSRNVSAEELSQIERLLEKLEGTQE